VSDELIELPEGWASTTIREAIEIIDYRGRTPPFSEDGIPHLRSSNIKNGQVVWEGLRFVSEETYEVFMTRGLPHVGDVLFTTEAPLGEVALAPEQQFSLAQRMMILRPNPNLLESSFLLYQIKNEEFQSKLKTTGTGSTVTGVSSRNFQPLELLIAPLNEQKRIVATIEALRERSQKARSALLAIPELCNKFRQSVLAAAFRGDLTAAWREQNPDVEPASVLLERISTELGQNFNDVQSEIDRADSLIPTSWAWARLKVIVKKIQPGNNFLCPEVPVTDNTVGLVKISAVTWGKFNPKETKTIADPSKVDPNLFIQPGDLLVTRANTLELVGASVVVDEIHYKIMLSDKVWRVDVLEVDKNYINFYLRSKDGRKEIESRATGNQLSMRNISQNAFKEIVIAIPPLEEQKEIVQQIASCFNSVDHIKQQYLETKDYLDHLDRSILAKAFRGELVEQDPNDEPASVLLDRIRADREQQMQGKIKKPGKKKRTGD